MAAIALLNTSAAEPPAAAWATFLSGPSQGISASRVIANPAGGFYLVVVGNALLIKFNADYSIAWTLKNEPGINDLQSIGYLDVFEDGDLLMTLDAQDGDRILGQTPAAGSYLARVRSQDASLAFLRRLVNCQITAIKTRSNGGFYLAGWGSGIAQIGQGTIQIGQEAVFLAQFTTGLDWATLGRGAGAPLGYPIGHIRTTGSGDNFRILAAGHAYPPPFVFGGQTIDQWAHFLVTLRGSGAVTRTESLPQKDTIVSLETRPSGGAHLLLEKENLGAPRSRFVRRLDGEGATVWEKEVDPDVWNIGESDNVFAVGYVKTNTTWFGTALDSTGMTVWRKGSQGRGITWANGCALLTDGRLLVAGGAANTGFFIDDFFLGDLSLVEMTPHGAWAVALEVSPNARPIFREQPRDQKLAVRGETVVLQAGVFSSGSHTVQWFKDGVALPGRNESALVLANVQANDRGIYFAEATNPAGATRSRSAEVIVNSVAVTTFAGTDTVGALDSPRHPVLLPNGAILAADPARHIIHKIDSSGVTVFAGTGVPGLKQGAPLESMFSAPSSLSVELLLGGFAKLYVADRGNNTIRRIRFSTTTGDASLVEEMALQLNAPNALATTDGILDFIIGESGISRVHRLSDGFLVRLAAQTEFGAIGGVAFDQRGNVFVADSAKHEALRIEPNGSVIRLAGHDMPGFVDGPALMSMLNEPSGATVDESGNMWITERGSHSVRKISPSGYTATIAGLGFSGTQNGGASEALFNAPEGLCFKNGSLIVADTGNHRLREIKFVPLTETETRLSASVSDSLHFSIAGRAGERFSIESSASIGSNATWTEDATVTIGAGELVLQRPSATRFFRARKIE